MSRAQIHETLECIENLPTLPAVATNILKLVNSRVSNMSQIAAVIARDQAISARVVRLVNSAFYGLRSRVSSIQHAIVILGLNTVKNLVLGVSVVKAFENGHKSSVFNREQFWIHTFSTALTSKLMAMEMKADEPEDYFLAGLLHDIGILTADQFLHERFVQILNRTAEGNGDYLDIEREVLGMSHGEVGAFLGEKWRVPSFLVNTMRFHHIPGYLDKEARAYDSIISVVHVADAVSRNRGIGVFAEGFGKPAEESIIRKLGISQVRMNELLNRVEKETKDLLREWGL